MDHAWFYPPVSCDINVNTNIHAAGIVTGFISFEGQRFRIRTEGLTVPYQRKR